MAQKIVESTALKSSEKLNPQDMPEAELKINNIELVVKSELIELPKPKCKYSDLNFGKQAAMINNHSRPI